jgi:hypothetical protein
MEQEKNQLKIDAEKERLAKEKEELDRQKRKTEQD